MRKTRNYRCTLFMVHGTAYRAKIGTQWLTTSYINSIISDRINIVLALVFVTSVSSAENTEERSQLVQKWWKDMSISSISLKNHPKQTQGTGSPQHPEVLNVKLVPAGVEVAALHLSLHILISGVREKACHLSLTVFNQWATCMCFNTKRGSWCRKICSIWLLSPGHTQLNELQLWKAKPTQLKLRLATVHEEI